MRKVVHAPAGVLAQVWRGSPRQDAIARRVHSRMLRVDPMADEAALGIGVILTGTRTPDVVDAHVALLAKGSEPLC